MRKNIVIALLAVALYAGVASAQTCTPITGSKAPAPHDDGNGINTLMKVNGNWVIDGQLTVIPANATSFSFGQTNDYGYVNALGGFGGCPPGHYNSFIRNGVIFADYSQANCNSGWPTCFDNRVVVDYWPAADTSSEPCDLTQQSNSCAFNATDNRFFVFTDTNKNWVHGHSYRAYAFSNVGIGQEGMSCTEPFNQYSGCVYSPLYPAPTNGSYWYFAAIYIQ